MKKKSSSSSASSPSSWIHSGDFDETSIRITGENTLTHLPIKSTQIEISEFSKNGMTIQLPNNSCAVGHILSFTIIKGVSAHDGPSDPLLDGITLTITAKVTEIEPLGKKSNSVTLQFYQFDEELWKKFTDSFSARQKVIKSVIGRMRGE